MKVAVVGATGRTGLECTKQLLEQGHSVSAVCRSSAKAYDLFSCIPRPQRARLNVCEVGNFEVEALKASFEGCEAIIFAACGVSFLGLFNRAGGPKHVDYGGVLACIEAIKASNSQIKFVLISSLGVTRPYWPIYIMLNTLGGRVMSYKLKGEEALRSSGLPQYCIIRPGRLMPDSDSNSHLKGTELIVAQGDKITGQILREDVARVAIYAALSGSEGPVNKCTFELISAASKNIESGHEGNVAGAPGRSKDCKELLQDLKSDLQLIK